MKKIKAIGISLILFGVLLTVGIIACQYWHCVQMWLNEGKIHMYQTAREYFFAVSKGAIFFAFVAGGIPVVAGIRLLRRTV